MWRCLCDCGNATLAAGSQLRRGTKRSCGCLAKEWASKMGGDRSYLEARIPVRHGHKRAGGVSPEYRTWLGMKRRCYSPKCKDYQNWGGRGIRVCDRWNASFEAFLHDMGPKPAGGSIDRIDPSKDYSPENCRWVPQSKQGAENRRSLKPMIIFGVEYVSQAAAARAFGIERGVLGMRLKAGATPEEAVTATRKDLAAKRDRTSYLRRDHPRRQSG